MESEISLYRFYIILANGETQVTIPGVYSNWVDDGHLYLADRERVLVGAFTSGSWAYFYKAP